MQVCVVSAFLHFSEFDRSMVLTLLNAWHRASDAKNAYAVSIL